MNRLSDPVGDVENGRLTKGESVKEGMMGRILCDQILISAQQHPHRMLILRDRKIPFGNQCAKNIAETGFVSQRKVAHTIIAREFDSDVRIL